MAEEIVSPARRTLEGQLAAPRFQAGVESGRWQLLLLAWPWAFVRVNGRDPDSGRTFTHDFRLECTGYPDPGPLVERWVFSGDPPYGAKPPAPSPGSPGFVDALKEWSPGGDIYRAWSREAANHNGWAAKRPDEAWHPRRDITFITGQLYAIATEQAVWLATRS